MPVFCMIQMAFNEKLASAAISNNTIIAWLSVVLMMSNFLLVRINGLVSDIDCLKSIKESMEDPQGNLESWNFNNQTEGFIGEFAGVESWNKDEDRVLGIALRDKGLRGQFPLGIAKCSALISLDLSRNELFGPIPSDIAGIIPYAITLDLSYNNLSREIPPGVAHLSNLTVLKLDHNHLHGQIPPQLGMLRRLKTFSVANNLLSGQVAFFYGNAVTSESYRNNPGLCGSPLPLCEDNHNFRAFVISGFLVGWSLFTSLVFTLTLFYFPTTIDPLIKIIVSTKKTKKKKKRDQKAMVQEKESPAANNQIHYSKIHTFDKCVTRMNYKYLLRVTDNFSQRNVIGLGKDGTLYRATLGYGNFLAVKRFGADFQQQHFMSEVLTIGRFRHRNLVPLLGFCIERKERLLVYKYMANGSLYDWLHPNNSDNNNNPTRAILEWPPRFRISIGIARGLAWLHHKFEHRITHGNICSKSILLDKNFDPKISNFDQAMIIESNRSNSNLRIFVNGESRELDGTLASKYECLVDAPKNDVYAFGILLLEVVTGEQPDDLSGMYSQGFCGNFGQWISHHRLDESLVGGSGLGLFDGEISQFLQVAFNCIRPRSNERPTMLKVYEALRAIGVENRDNFLPAPQIMRNSDIEIVEEIE